MGSDAHAHLTCAQPQSRASKRSAYQNSPYTEPRVSPRAGSTSHCTRLSLTGFLVDVLVNCAGVTLDKTVSTLSLVDWQHIIDTNLTGTF
jgi:NADP-dependent 3-hydroxy acid dehydrogenase YdfG